MSTTITGNFVDSSQMWLFILMLIWTLPWKGTALWKAARLSHKKWFIIMLLINSIGILEIIYIFFVARKYTVETEVKEEK
jgi:methionyl-tRNA synthetase